MNKSLPEAQADQIIAELSKRDNLEEIKESFTRLFNDPKREDCTDAIGYYADQLAQAQAIHTRVNWAVAYLRSKPTIEWLEALELIRDSVLGDLVSVAKNQSNSEEPFRDAIRKGKIAGIAKYLECVGKAIDLIRILS